MQVKEGICEVKILSHFTSCLRMFPVFHCDLQNWKPLALLSLDTLISSNCSRFVQKRRACQNDSQSVSPNKVLYRAALEGIIINRHFTGSKILTSKNLHTHHRQGGKLTKSACALSKRSMFKLLFSHISTYLKYILCTFACSPEERCQKIMED